MRHILFALAGLLILSACGPVYSTEYQMISPKSQSGRTCVNNCLLAQTNCRQQCTISRNHCEQTESLRAENEYLRYVQERRELGREIKRSRSSFNSSYRCDDDNCAEECANTQRLCYSNCGGQVIPTTRCTAFCDQAN